MDVPGPRRVDLQDADITPSMRSAFDALCEKYPKVFSKGNENIGRMQLVTMDIDMGDSPPVSSRPYTLALKHHKWVQEEIETLERAGIITKSMFPWASPIVIVPKKSQPGEPPKKRLCIDFRKINDLQQKVITEGKSKGCLSLIPLPKIDEMYAKLKGAKFFSTIDLRSGYYHIALGKDSRAKTAFVMPFGKYKFLQVPFGLAQAPAFFQHLMNKVLDNCLFAMTYLDDIIIFSDMEQEHLAHIEEIFKRLEAADLKMKRSKCDFFKKHIHNLGHLISADGIQPLKDKLDRIHDMPAPHNSKELYDTGAMKSCMSLKTFESLKLKLTDDRCPFIVTATGTSMEPIGFTQCSFNINGHSFTQKFIVCSNQTRPIILGKDFAS